MTTFLLELEYDGSEFAGWQRQAEGQRTVQGTLEAAFADLAGAPVAVAGAGRTDAGVHAEGQAASVSLATTLSTGELLRAIDARLPPDLALRQLQEVPEGFDARRDALRKLYRYRIWNAAHRSPLRARNALQHVRRLDLPAMQRAADALVGRHDFAAFQATGSSVRTSIRTLERLTVTGEAGAEVSIDAQGDGFLRHMVRNLVGTLLEVGDGRRGAGSVADVLASRDRAQAGPTAPAHGLTLVRVDYGIPRETEPLAPSRA